MNISCPALTVLFSHHHKPIVRLFFGWVRPCRALNARQCRPHPLIFAAGTCRASAGLGFSRFPPPPHRPPKADFFIVLTRPAGGGGGGLPSTVIGFSRIGGFGILVFLVIRSR